MWYCGGWRGRKCDIIEKIGDCGNQTYISYDSLKDRGKKMNYYKMLCEKMKINPKDTYAIEDSHNGVRSAAAAGLRVLHVRIC